MSDSEAALLRDEVQHLRKAVRRQQLFLYVSLIAFAGSAVSLLGRPESAAAQSTPDKDGVVHVRGLVVGDQHGHERVRLGAPLPDPMIQGVWQKRQGVISGLLISDADGNERGGYVTSDASGEAFLSLDSEDEQKMLLLANAKGGVNFVLSNNDGNNMEFTAFPDGPKFRMRKAHQIILEFNLRSIKAVNLSSILKDETRDRLHTNSRASK